MVHVQLMNNYERMCVKGAKKKSFVKSFHSLKYCHRLKPELESVYGRV